MLPLFGSLNPLGMSRKTGVTYLLRDEFTNGPLVSPRTMEPGPGTWTVTDPGGVFSIVGGQLIFNGTPGALSGLIGSVGLVRSSGVVFSHTVVNIVTGTLSNKVVLFRSATFGAVEDHAYPILDTAVTNMAVRVGNTFITGLGPPTYPAKHYIILRSAGAFYVVNSNLVWVDNSLAGSTLYPGLQSTTTATNCILDRFLATQLGAPWDTDYGVATSRTASAGAGATGAMASDGLVEATWTPGAGDIYELSIRRTDDDNRWVIRCDQVGGTIKLIQRQAGSETERSSAAQVWTVGTAYRVVAFCNTGVIRTYTGVTLKNSYLTASFNQTATGIKTSHAVIDLVAWPRTLSGAALAALEAI